VDPIACLDAHGRVMDIRDRLEADLDAAFADPPSRDADALANELARANRELLARLRSAGWSNVEIRNAVKEIRTRRAASRAAA
jgi:hypothetical protein